MTLLWLILISLGCKSSNCILYPLGVTVAITIEAQWSKVDCYRMLSCNILKCENYIVNSRSSQSIVEKMQHHVSVTQNCKSLLYFWQIACYRCQWCKLIEICSYLQEAGADSFLIGCGPVRSALLCVLNMIACNSSRTSIDRLFPFNHQWIISHFTESQVIGRTYRTHTTRGGKQTWSMSVWFH